VPTRNEQIGGGILILSVVAGSKAQGLDTAGSDLDTRGVCIPSRQYLLGLTRFEQWSDESNDHVIYALDKFVRLGLEGNPNIIETLFTDEADFLFVDETYGRPLIDHRGLFLSKQVGIRFGHYAMHQLEKIERHHRWIVDPSPQEPAPAEFQAQNLGGRWRFPDANAERAFKAAHKKWKHYTTWRAERNPARASLEEAHGYDTKHASHLCRLLLMGLEILQTGEVHVKRLDAEWLKGVRTGSMDYPEILAWATRKIAELNRAVKESTLPDEPDRATAQEIVVSLQQRFICDQV
jgi:predicted nucleotidyltransferase